MSKQESGMPWDAQKVKKEGERKKKGKRLGFLGRVREQKVLRFVDLAVALGSCKKIPVANSKMGGLTPLLLVLLLSMFQFNVSWAPHHGHAHAEEDQQ